MEDKISLYDWLKAHDVFTWLEPLWDSGNWFLNEDGKLQVKFNQIAINTPWVHHGHLDRNLCYFGQLVFNTVSMQIKNHFVDFEPFVPSDCQECYKVVVRPQTVVQLFALNELQEKIDLPCKCGIEPRSSVDGLYGGYFYNRGLEAGKECYQKVRKLIDNDRYLGPEIPVILKRACTEMEHGVGPSDQWKITEEQLIIEKLVKEWIVFERDDGEMPDPIIWRTKKTWIEWARSHGDKTYLKFTGNQNILPGYITYHSEVVNNDMQA